MRSAGQAVLGAVAIAGILIAGPSRAEESGSGHYMPGANASFIDALPPRTGWALASFFSYYTGSAGARRDIPLGGLVAANLDATAYAETIVAMYRSSLALLGGYYTVGVGIPYVWMTASGQVQATGPGGATITTGRRESNDGLGDIVVYPVMIAWSGLGGDARYDFRFGVYLPTGDYDEGSLANLGKNYWTFEPEVTFSWISSKIGLETSVFAGVDLNTQNSATQYRSGSQLHLDATLAQHLPLLGGAVGVGVGGFYYQQLGNDTGPGAVLGAFKGRTVGVGPVLSYASKVSRIDVAAEVKWLTELDVENRLDGDSLWFKLGIVL